MLSVTKDFTFDAAHRLVNGYEGKCKNIHGHTYHAFITVQMYEVMESDHAFVNIDKDKDLVKVDLDKFGFVEDFDKLKKVKEWVDSNWDHAMLVSPKDLLMLEFLNSNEQKYYVMLDNPTVENMCSDLMKIAKGLLNTERVFVSKIIIYETPTSCAILEGI